MPHILKNNLLEVHIDLPSEGYKFSRFDWTGKITKVQFQGLPVTTIERTGEVDADRFGKGLYNEFGIESAIGFEETQPGDWFHKIGVGALKKTAEPYLFTTPYEIRAATFHVEPLHEALQISCTSENLNGYAYKLTKEFLVKEDNLIIHYRLKNTGQKALVTDEYVHNFIGIDQDLIGKEYELRLPFHLEKEAFQMLVNPEGKMTVEPNKINFNSTPEEQFFISHLNGSKTVRAHWELRHLKTEIGICETGSFNTQKVNLWGWQHVVSPELFHNIALDPGKSEAWSRTYLFSKTQK